MESLFKPMSKEALEETVNQIVLEIQTVNGPDFVTLAQKFTYELSTIERFSTLGYEERQTEFQGLFNSTPEIDAFESSQIKLCVIASLTSTELDKLRVGVWTAQAQERGFEGYFERISMCEDLAERIIKLLNVGRGLDSPEYKIAKAFAHKYGGLLARHLLPLQSIEQAIQIVESELMHSPKEELIRIMGDLKIADEQLGTLTPEG